MDYNEVAEDYEKFEDITEWELGYKEVFKLLGDVNNKIILDYGAGNLKFSRFLRDRGAKCIAVEPSKKMLKIAEKYNNSGIKVHEIKNNDISFLKSNSVDMIVINFVFCVISNKDEIKQIIKESYRILKKDGLLVILDPNPESIGRDFLSFKSEKPKSQESGTAYRIKLKLNSGFVNLIDYYWPLEDYIEFLKKGGFKKMKILEPMIDKDSCKKWLDEKIKPPYIIIRTQK